MSRHLLPLIPAALHVLQVLPAPDRITILTAPKPSSSACPLCGAVSSRVHSHYNRTLADLPWQGRAVTVQVRARRFRCAAVGCLRQVFAERLPEVAPSWARRTARLGDIQRHIGFALGGDRTFENQGFRASRLSLLTAAIVYWNTIYLDRAVQQLRSQGIAIPDDLLAHVAPLGWEHIALTGDYDWNTTRPADGLRSLRPVPQVFTQRAAYRACVDGSLDARRMCRSVPRSGAVMCPAYLCGT